MEFKMINKQKATIYEFFKYIWVQKKLILLLGINDFKQRYSKSYLGLKYQRKKNLR